jgi:glycosyltransferase involved in cell wall biosynthesis
MAAKNYARFLPTAVESVQAQSFENWELVVVDDGSTDDTPSVIRPFLADRRIRYVRSDRLGQSRAKNLGIGLSRGEFVAFLDADDAWLPTKLERQIAAFDAEPDVGVVHCLRSLIDANGTAVPRTANPAATRLDSTSQMDAFYVRNPICFSSCVVRRSIFDLVGGFDPLLDLAIDYDLWLRVARVTSFHCVPEDLVLYRTGHGNLSKKLADRVATAFSIMHRAERRGGVSRSAAAEGKATTSRTLGYVVRGAEPGESIRWYLRALAIPHRRLETWKGLTAAILKWGLGKRVSGSAENLTINK